MRSETAKTIESPGRAAARIFAGIAVAFSILGAVVLMSQPADAQQLCLLHEAAAKQLAEQYDESVVGREGWRRAARPCSSCSPARKADGRWW